MTKYGKGDKRVMPQEKQVLIVTNNYKAMEKYRGSDRIGVEYLERGGYLDVLLRVRDLIHSGWHLLTHPQSSNLKPMQTPYKSVVVSPTGAAQPFVRDIEMIESAIAGYEKFTAGKTLPAWTDRIRDDFCTVDLAVIDSAISSPVLQNFAQGGFGNANER